MKTLNVIKLQTEVFLATFVLDVMFSLLFHLVVGLDSAWHIIPIIVSFFVCLLARPALEDFWRTLLRSVGFNPPEVSTMVSTEVGDTSVDYVAEATRLYPFRGASFVFAFAIVVLQYVKFASLDEVGSTLAAAVYVLEAITLLYGIYTICRAKKAEENAEPKPEPNYDIMQVHSDKEPAMVKIIIEVPKDMPTDDATAAFREAYDRVHTLIS